VKLHETSEAFEVLIGVAGRTGAGKSTILNMLLEIPELLPSSNSEAATSCACRVSRNNDDTPGRQFRAEVVFRSREDVAKELQHIFAMVQEHRDFNEEEADDGDDAFERMEEEAEIQNAIAEEFKKISAVWGLDEEAAERMSAEGLLLSNSDVLELLGTTKTIYSEDAEKFAETVKPYLDSSENLQGFRAWPLITEVRLFVIAPFLKHGEPRRSRKQVCTEAADHRHRSASLPRHRREDGRPVDERLPDPTDAA
jgi:energy-coupling factor transporter ATP-binding protein EcfA2